MAPAEHRNIYWPIDVMCGCVAAIDNLDSPEDADHRQLRSEALAIYAVASAGREADRKIPVPEWLEDYIADR